MGLPVTIPKRVQVPTPALRLAQIISDAFFTIYDILSVYGKIVDKI